jgi:hypothetical protein
MIIDGATNWGKDGPRPAADGFDSEARSKSIYEWVRQVRGGVLAGAFTVERHISGAIIYFMLGDRIVMPEVQEAFDEGLLRSAQLRAPYQRGHAEHVPGLGRRARAPWLTKRLLSIAVSYGSTRHSAA